MQQHSSPHPPHAAAPQGHAQVCSACSRHQPASSTPRRLVSQDHKPKREKHGKDGKHKDKSKDKKDKHKKDQKHKKGSGSDKSDDSDSSGSDSD